eukprot:jgi/Tetstr1/431668/TSEL_021197.t1
MPSADGDLPMLRLLGGGLAFGTSAHKEELVRSWRDDARTEALYYAGHARQRRTDYDADFVAALLVGTTDTGVTLAEDGELSRAAGRLSSKGMGDLSDFVIFG